MSATAALPWMLGAAWGAALALPIARHAAHVGINERATGLSARTRRSSRSRVSYASARWWRRHSNGVVLRVVRSLGSRRRARGADVALAREVPVALDLLGVAVGAGCTPYLAVEVAARWSPAPVAAAFTEVLRSCALGLDFQSALDAVARATPRLRPVADALLATDRLGVPVGPVLVRLAEEDRTALRRAAEAHARRIPVRLLFPLVFLVLPAFVLLTVVPGLAAGLGRL
jgi:pilus assembly protein TadC